MKDANFHGVVVVIVVVVMKFLLLLSRSTDWCLNIRHDTRSRFTLLCISFLFSVLLCVMQVARKLPEACAEIREEWT